MALKISVIIPVYNAAEFVVEAVESAIAQIETAEVILVEDGSTDNGLKICRDLAKANSKVHLLQHPGGVNKGVAASRNLGMQNAKSEYIAFLDADDFFLPGRFRQTDEVFSKNPDCDGVYEAIGTCVEDKEARNKWIASGEMKDELITMVEGILPEQLFDRLLSGGSGYFSIIGLTLRKSILQLTGLMNENLHIHEDTEYIYRLAALGTLLPGKLDEPVSVRRVHQSNTTTASRDETEKFEWWLKMWLSSYRWFEKEKLFTHREKILQSLLSFYSREVMRGKSRSRGYFRELSRRLKLFRLIFMVPTIIFRKQFWRKFLPVSYQSQE